MKRIGSAALAAVVSTVLIVGVSTPAEAATATKASGYKIKKSSKAAGSWVGSYNLGGQLVYRTDPTKRAKRSKHYGSVRESSSWKTPRGGKVSTGRMTRAAWILSKYGAYGSSLQAAAVDTAVLAELNGGSYKVTGKSTKKRLRSSKQSRPIMRLAKTMLAQASAEAGPYEVELKGPGGAVSPDSQVRFTARIYSTRTGAGVSGLPVEFTSSKGGTVAAVTDATGVAMAAFTSPSGGQGQVTAAVSKVPASTLAFAKAKHGGSRVVVAGRKQTIARSVGVTWVDRPSASVAATAGSVPAGGATQAVVTVSGSTPGGGNRTATASLYGPFSFPAGCFGVGGPVATVTATVSGDGQVAMPAVGTGGPGYYVWSASVGGNSLNEATATVCSGAVAATTTPAISVTTSDSQVSLRQTLHGNVSIGAYPRGMQTRATVRIFGPFSSADVINCGDGKLYQTTSIVVQDNGRYSTGGFQLSREGYYALRAQLDPTAVSGTVLSECRAGGSIIHSK
jgi:hypothetical protein